MLRKKKGRPVKYPSSNELPEELESHLREIAKQMKGKPLNLTEDSPLKTLIGHFVEIALQEEISEHLGYEKSEEQEQEEGPPPTSSIEGGSSSAARASKAGNTRNGYSGKRLKTTHGETDIRVPRDRSSTFEPKIVPKYRSISEEVESRIVSMYTRGMTTRDIQDHVEELYGFQASEMFVTRVVERLDPELAAWRSRPLEAIYGIVFVDAIHLKVRHASGVRSTAVYQVTGYGEGGTLEILSLQMAPEGSSPAESASFWHQVLVELEQRGVKDILIICADSLTGLDKAIEAVYPKASLQPCVVHLMRSSLSLLNYDAAEIMLPEIEERYGKRYPHLSHKWTEALPRLANLYRYSPQLRKLVYTTNPIENINRQIRKVTKNRGALPNVESALRLLTLIVRKIDTDNRKHVRQDWIKISKELAIHFPERLPQDWGVRLFI